MRIIIIGAGEVGFNIASKLEFEGKDVVLIDKNISALNKVTEKIDIKAINGSGSDPRMLEKAGIIESEILLAVADSDEANLSACLIADLLSPYTKKIARIRSDGFAPYYERLRKNIPHINTVINPDIEVVKTIINLMNLPGVVEIVDFADGYMKFVGVKIDIMSSLVGIKLSKINSITKNTRLLIVAILRNDKLIIPKGNDILDVGDLAYFITTKNELPKTMSVLDPNIFPANVKSVIIIGGGTIGYNLAKKIESNSISCKIVEKENSRCKHLAKKLNKTIILHGDGSDQNLLNEENISNTDVVITLTNDEETNVLISLLAKRMGAKKTITQVNNFSYFPFMSTIGIEQVVSSRLSAVNTILQHIRKGKILSAVSIKDEAAEIMEAVALPTSDLVSKPLKKISFPKEAMIVGIIKNKNIIIPNGNSIVEPGDRVVVFAKNKAISGVEKALSVKLEYF